MPKTDIAPAPQRPDPSSWPDDRLTVAWLMLPGLAVLVFSAISGDQFLTWGDAAATSLDPGMPLRQFKHAQQGIDALQDWMRGHFETLRRNPGDDVLSQLVNSADSAGSDGERPRQRRVGSG